MSFVRSRQIYEAMPLAAKRAICSVPFGWIAGSQYRTTFSRGAAIDTLSSAEVLAQQERSLGEILRFATDQVPAYKKFSRAVERFSALDAIKEFPLLDKDDLQERFEDFVPRDIANIAHYEISTGGTSGNQLDFYVDDSSQAVEMGFIHRLWQRVGYTSRKRKATFRGVSFAGLKSGTYWQHNPIYNELQFSPFHMSEKTLMNYVDQIVSFKPSFFHGFPSAIDILAEYVIRNNLQNQLPTLEAVFLGSEGTIPGQKERIQSAFGARVFSWYGHSERLILAGECEFTDAYHQFPDYGFFEIVDDNSVVRSGEGERGELIGTGFLNRSMPLIRYKTNDYATRLDPVCKCGRHWDRFTDVVGRWDQDMVIGKQGARISIAALNMHGALFSKVLRYQYFQQVAGESEIRLMVSPEFTENDRLAVENAYSGKVGNELTVVARVVEDIPLTQRGKLKLLISEIANEG
jgi:phenylacetate-CoA ligase